MKFSFLQSIKRQFPLYRDDFPLLQKKKELIYFDTAATAQKPACVIRTLADFYAEEYATVHRSIYSLSRNADEKYSQARKRAKEFLNAAFEDEIIFTRGTTASLNLVARSFCKAFLKKGDVILLSEIEHHANLVPWQFVAEERGLIIKFMPVNESGELILEEAEKLFDERVKIVSCPHISNSIGVKHPVKKLVEIARRWNAKVCLDGAQSAAHLPIDVQDLDVDFFAFSAHKAYGPTGLGILYGKRELLNQMPPIEGGGDMIERVTLAKTTFAPLPLKFEAGTPMIASVVGLKASLDYLMAMGMEKIAKMEEDLLSYALTKLKEIPDLKIVGDGKTRGAIISFSIKGVHPLDLGTLLDCKGIALRTGHLCSQPTMDRFGVTSLCRLSFGLYNTTEEMDRFIVALKNILTSLR